MHASDKLCIALWLTLKQSERASLSVEEHKIIDLIPIPPPTTAANWCNKLKMIAVMLLDWKGCNVFFMLLFQNRARPPPTPLFSHQMLCQHSCYPVVHCCFSWQAHLHSCITPTSLAVSADKPKCVWAVSAPPGLFHFMCMCMKPLITDALFLPLFPM